MKKKETANIIKITEDYQREIKRLNKVCKAYWQSRSEFIEENQKLKELLLKFKINVI